MKQKFLDEMGRLIPQIHRALARKGSGVLTKGTITVPQMVLLEFVNEKHMCTVTDIAKNMGITKSAITGLTDRLIRSNLITRTRGIKDRRIVLISLTSKGKTAILRLLQERDNTIRKAFEGLTDKERGLYLELLRKMYGNLVKTNEV
ncbi:MAG: MarR family transcriptional regulator [Candidatus Omnitrophica bacterium]|nr:MarR family transcriptional regulator [Candidatus Omnitrophota bacterium]